MGADSREQVDIPVSCIYEKIYGFRGGVQNSGEGVGGTLGCVLKGEIRFPGKMNTVSVGSRATRNEGDCRWSGAVRG